MARNHTITAVPGFKVGHWQSPSGRTGCSVVLCPRGTIGGSYVAGGGPESFGLNEGYRYLTNSSWVHAVFLAGGSRLGFGVGVGVQNWLFRAKRSAPTVWGACLFEGTAKSQYPTVRAGYLACKRATDQPVRQGNIGAGTGASSGKLLGFERGTKTGLGSVAASLRLGDEAIMMGALVVVNAIGCIVDPQMSQIIAGARGDSGQLVGEEGLMRYWSEGSATPPSGPNTILAVIATNARLDRHSANWLARMASAGIPRTVFPAFTTWDGDIVFTLCGNGKSEGSPQLDVLGHQAAKLLASAILAATRSARSVGSLPAARDLQPVPVKLI